MKFIRGKKQGMTQIFDEAGRIWPATIIVIDQAGEQTDSGQLNEGDLVKVSGISKAKGFQGVVKRHGFHGGPRTHGQKHSEREPGSIGSGLRTRVPLGTRMAGRMGGVRVTIKNLRVLKVDKENNLLVVSGAIPGRRGTALEIRANKNGN